MGLYLNIDILSQYDMIIFDCDGVLIDINLFKCEAFGEAVSHYPYYIVNNFVNHCKESFGVSRYVKFKEFLSRFANVPYRDEEYYILLNNYSKLCSKGYEVANLTPGCESLLMVLNNHSKELYIVSGSDEEELNQVFTKRDLSRYFNGIFGSPKTKLECTSIILDDTSSKKAVFIGDALSDMKTAKEKNIDFIYMSNFTVQSEEQDRLCREGAIITINTLEDLM